MIEVELPDGSIAEFPDGTAPDVIKGALRKRFGGGEQTPAPGKQAREMSMGETFMDTAKSFGSGLAQGGMSLVGAIGDAQQMSGDVAAWGAGKLGLSQDTAREIGQRIAIPGIMVQGPRTQQIRQGVESVTGPMYEPQSTIGEYAQTVGEFAPGAALGPGGVARKTAMAVVPGIASEAAGQATEGTALEPYARVGGALAGGVVAAGRGNAPMRQMIKDAPSDAAVRGQKNTLYKALEQAGVKYDANAYGQWAQQLEAKLMQEGLDPTLHPQATAVLKRVVSEVGNSPDFTKMETLRKLAGEATRGSAATSPADLNRAGVILKEIDQFFGGAPLISNGTVPAGQVNQMAKQARELARRNIIARDIQEMDRKSQFYVSGPESGQRNQFANYMRSPKGKTLTEAERQAFEKVIKREGIENVLHNTGSRMAQIGTGAAGIASIPMAGPIGPAISAAAILGNMGARKVMEKLTDKRVRDALATALAGKDAQSKALTASQSAKRDAIVRALIATGTAVPDAIPSRGQ